MSDLGNRANYIGGSDVPIILGLSPFKTRGKLLREKITGIVPQFTTRAQAFGNEYESVLIEADQILEDYELLDCGWCADDASFALPIICHFDKVVRYPNDDIVLIECKTGKEPFNGVLPAHYMAQVQTYMHILNAEFDEVKRARILFGWRLPDGTLGEREAFFVDFNPNFWPSVKDEISKFADEVIEGRKNPEKYAKPAVDSAVMDEIYALTLERNDIDARLDELKETAAKQLESANQTSADDGQLIITRRADSVAKRFDSAAFKNAEPELYEKFCKETTTRGGIVVKIKDNQPKGGNDESR